MDSSDVTKFSLNFPLSTNQLDLGKFRLLSETESERLNNNDFDNAMLVGQFDSKNYFHLVNVRNFDYVCVSQEIMQEFEDKDSEEENIIGDEEMDKQSFKSEKNQKTTNNK